LLLSSPYPAKEQTLSGRRLLLGYTEFCANKFKIAAFRRYTAFNAVRL